MEKQSSSKTRPIIAGSLTALVTPFRNGRLDETSFIRLIEWQIASETNGLVILGTTGESPTVSFKEHLDILAFAIDTVGGRIPVIAGTGANATDEAIMLTQKAEALGADACLSVVPYYNKPSQAGLHLHFKTIAENTQLPILLYDVPGRTGVKLETNTIARLAAIPNIIGIKVTTGDMRQISDIIAACGPAFSIFSGDDFTNFSLLTLGGAGGISVASNVAPQEMAEFWRVGLAGNWQHARALHLTKLYPLSQLLFLESNPIMVKAALHLMSMLVAEYRLPLCAPSDANLQTLQAGLTSLGFIKD